MSMQETRIYVCHGPTCSQHQARQIWSALQSEVRACRLSDRCELIVSGCQGRCDHGPNINVYPNLTKYAHLTPEKVRRIVHEHLAEGHPVAEYTYRDEW
ncbi:MAG TPA: (2Fe-2S) ferredoxin domain-containing protein [Herpetosiphonaceae bacterium]